MVIELMGLEFTVGRNLFGSKRSSYLGYLEGMVAGCFFGVKSLKKILGVKRTCSKNVKYPRQRANIYGNVSKKGSLLLVNTGKDPKMIVLMRF